MVALALVVGALCGRSAVLSVTDTSSTSLGSPHLDRDLDAEVLWNQTAQDEMDAGNQTAQEEAALGLNLEVLCGGGNSKIKVKFSMHSILDKVGVTKCLLKACIPNPKFNMKFPLPEIHGKGICDIIDMAEIFADLIKESDIEEVVKLIPGIGPAVAHLRDLVLDAKELVQTAPQKAAGMKTIATSLTDMPATLNNLAETVFKSMFPFDKSALMNLINKEFQSLLTSASAEASLGLDASSDDASFDDATRNFLVDDERAVRSAVRVNIRAALRGEADAANSTTSMDQMPPAALGALRLGKICFNAPEVDIPVDVRVDIPARPLGYLMYWPAKLAKDPSKPFDVKLPRMKTETCINLSFEAGLVDVEVAIKLVKVFFDFFKPIIFKGLKAVMDEVLGDADAILALVQPVIDTVGDVTEQYDNVKDIFSSISGRKLLSKEDEDDNAHQRSDALRNVLEERLLRKAMELRKALIADPFMEDNFMETHLPGVDVDRPIAELGGAFKNAIASKARGRFDTALQGMKNTKFEVSFTQTFEMDILIKLPHGGFQTGDLIHLMVEPKPCPLFKFRKDIPISPPLMGSLQIAGDFQIPYFFKSDVSGEFRYTVKVDLELKVTVSGSDLPTVEFKEPIVEVTKNSGFQHGKTSLQVGAKAIINKFFVGLCVGPVCTGPFAKATQALYVGFDAFTGDRTGGISGNSCVNKAVVKNKLQTAFVDWEYPDGVCTLDGTDSGTGFGAYLNIPKTQASVTMSTFDASPWAKNSGLNFVWHDFNVQKQIGEGDWHMKELFPPQCTSDLLNGGVSISRG